MDGLLSVQILRVLDVEAEEVAQFGRGVDFGLPCVLALAQHGRGHDFEAVFAGDQVGGFEEDGGAGGEGEGFPCWLCGEGGGDGVGDGGGAGVGVSGDDVFVVGGIGLGEGRCFSKL